MACVPGTQLWWEEITPSWELAGQQSLIKTVNSAGSARYPVSSYKAKNTRGRESVPCSALHMYASHTHMADTYTININLKIAVPE